MKVTVIQERDTVFKVEVDGVTVALYDRGSLIVFDPETPHDYNKNQGGGVVFSIYPEVAAKVQRHNGVNYITGAGL